MFLNVTRASLFIELVLGCSVSVLFLLCVFLALNSQNYYYFLYLQRRKATTLEAEAAKDTLTSSTYGRPPVEFIFEANIFRQTKINRIYNLHFGADCDATTNSGVVVDVTRDFELGIFFFELEIFFSSLLTLNLSIDSRVCLSMKRNSALQRRRLRSRRCLGTLTRLFAHASTAVRCWLFIFIFRYV